MASRLAVPRALPVLASLLALLAAAPAAVASHTAVDDAYAVEEDALLSAAAPGVLANDAPDPEALSAAVVVGPTHAAAFALDADGGFVYTPEADFNGTDTFTYIALDGLGEPSGPATVTIIVDPMNDAPVANDDPGGGCAGDPTAFGGALPVPEDPRGYSNPYYPPGYEDWSLLIADCILQNDTDVDGDPLTLEFVGEPLHGDVANIENVLIAYRPDPDYSTLPGDLPGGEWHSDLITYRAFDGFAYSNPVTIPIWVAPVNDPPTFTPGPEVIEVTEDSGPYSAAWATDVRPGPDNESYQTVVFEILELDLMGFPNFFSVPPAIDSSGVLTFTPAPNGWGAARVTVRAVDDGGTEEYSPWCHCYVPPDDTSDEAILAITVTPVHDAPVADDKVAATDEDTPVDIILTASSVETYGLGIDVSDPAHGTLTLGDTTCSPVSCSHQVSYTPDPDYNGPDSFTYTADDGSLASAPATVTITIDAVNDAPSFTKGADDAVAEDSGARTVAGWATSIAAGPLDEASQAVTFEVVGNTNPSLLALGPSVAPNGTLTYTPAANRSGSATISVRLVDDGGAANGGVGASAAQSFTITVDPVNDPPNAVNDESFVVVAGSGPTALDVLANDSLAPDTGEVLTIVAASPPSHGSVVITSGGSGLTYQPSAFFEGTDAFTYTISDGALTDTATVVVTIVPEGGLTRQWGADRYATAAAISAATFAPGVPVAYIATGTDFPDALAGAAAAGHRGGPVLLVSPNLGVLPAATAAELTRLAPQSIVVLGGPGAVPDAIHALLDPYTAGP